MSQKEHSGETILAFNAILPIVARKYAKLTSFTDSGKKARVTAETTLPENTARAVQKLMSEYGFPAGNINAAIQKALHASLKTNSIPPP